MFLLREGSFILVGRSFQIVGPETLNDLVPNVIVLALRMYNCPDVADHNCLGWELMSLRYSHSPGREVPIRSNTGTLKWQS